MKNKLLLILILFCLGFIGCKNSSGNNNQLPVKVPTSFAYFYTTPKGVSISSVVELPVDKKELILNTIDKGILTQITTCGDKYPSWTSVRNNSDYNLMFIEPDRINQDGSPALMYKGIYQTAGTVIGLNNDGYSPTTIVLPHQGGQNWAYLYYLEQSSRNESEHFAEWYNDKNIFQYYANANDVHPHCKLVGE